MTTTVREVYERETPPARKGVGAYASIGAPSSLTIENATRLQVLRADGMELRERRLSINLVAGTVSSNQRPGGMGPLRSGFYSFFGAANSFETGCIDNEIANAAIMVTAQGYSRRQICMDVKSGVYRIPPCGSVTVEIMLSQVIAGALVQPDFLVECELSDSCEGPVTRPTMSSAIELAAAEEVSFSLSPYARWIDMCCRCEFFGTFGNPILTLFPGQVPDTTGNSLFRDYGFNTFFPSGGPVEISASNARAGANHNPMYNMRNDGVVTAQTVVTQFLEW